MLLSVVVISWNSKAMLTRCLETLAEAIAPYGHQAEVIWVDNGSTDGSCEYVRTHYPEIQRIVLDRNYGVAVARNHGIQAATGRYIFFVDDDAEATPQALQAMLDHMEANPGTGLCAVALRDSDGNLQQSFKPYPGIGIKIRNVLRSFGRDNDTTTLPTHVIHPCYVIGACQMIRASLFEKFGLLDSHIFYGPEDADFCLRIARGGYTIDYLPHISMLHHWRRATRRNIFSPLSRRHMRALLYFYCKHRRFF